MPLTTKTYDWAVTGTKTPPSAGRQQSGWVPGEQPAIGDENWIQNGQDVAIRELQTGDSPNTANEDIDQAAYAKGDHSKAWAYPFDAENIYSTGTATDQLVDLALCYISGEKRILVLEQNAGEIHIVEPLTAAIESTISNALLVLRLPTTTGVWKPLSMCADDASVYVLFEEVGGASIRHYVQAYDLITGSAKVGWPATGTQITTGNLTAEFWTTTDNRTSRIMFGNDTYLVTLNSWVAVASPYTSTDPMLSALLVSNGTLQSEGCGDLASAGAASTQYAYGGLAADWDGSTPAVYFTCCDSSNSSNNICSALLSSMSTGAGYTAIPYTTGAGNTRLFNELAFDGFRLWATSRPAFIGGDSYSLSTNVAVFDPKAGTSADFYRGDYGACSPRFLAFDGLNMYMTGRVVDSEAAASDTDFSSVLRLNPTAITYTITGSNINISPSLKSRFILEGAQRSATSTTRDANVDYQGPILFDGKDLWCILDIRGSQTFSAKVYRLPRAAIR
jgi:hypothetical protein